MKNFILIILMLVFSGSSKKELPLKKCSPESAELADASQSVQLNTDGLYFAEFYDYIFRGHFENVQISREDMMLLTIFDSYLRTFSKNCSEYLPAETVDIMDTFCQQEMVEFNGYGVEINRYCSDWGTRPSGEKARSELYDALLYVEGLQSANALGTALSMMTDPNAVGNSIDMIHKLKGLQNDMQEMFRQNPCGSPGIRRFEENLRLFALNKASIRMEGESKYALMKKTGGPSGPQDLDKLVDDLVIDQSKTWAFNRYIPGSINGLTVQSMDTQGRPREVKANYSYNGFGGKSNGWVRVTFNNGLPDCIYFFDFPNNCKHPNSSILTSYSEGKYSGM